MEATAQGKLEKNFVFVYKNQCLVSLFFFYPRRKQNKWFNQSALNCMRQMRCDYAYALLSRAHRIKYFFFYGFLLNYMRIL